MEKEVKIIHFDIETFPILSYTWGLYEQNVIAKVKDWGILCFAWSYEGSDEVHSYSIRDSKKKSLDDSKVVKKLWELFNEADILSAHNGISFDIKKCNARFAYYKLPPPSPYKVVDTKRIAKSVFQFDSNSLKDLAKYLGLTPKVETGGFSLWEGCMRGDNDAWDKMIEYNKGDVITLKEVYTILKPWAKSHPNLNIIANTTHNCPTCLSGNVQKRGTYPKNLGAKGIIQWQRYCCMKCGKWSSAPKEESPIR